MSQIADPTLQPTSSAPTDTSYADILSKLVSSDTPQDELLRLLAGGASPKPEAEIIPAPKNPEVRDTQKTAINTVFRILQSVQGALQHEITTKVDAALRPSNPDVEEPEALRGILHQKSAGVTLLCALQPKNEGNVDGREAIAEWETTSRAFALTDLKTNVIKRAALSLEPLFERAQGDPEQKRILEEGIRQFREVSRNFELIISSRSNMQAGPGKAALASRRIPPKGIEIIACLTQIAIESLRRNTERLSPAEEKTVRGFQSKARRAFGMLSSAAHSTDQSQRRAGGELHNLVHENLAQACPESTSILKNWQAWKTPTDESLAQETAKITGALFEKMELEPESQEQLKNIIENSGKTNDLDPSQSGLDKEFATIAALERYWNVLDTKLDEVGKANPASQKSKRPGEIPTAEELKNSPLALRVYAALRRESPGIGKASCMVLLQRIIGNKENVSEFTNRELDKEENLLSEFGFVQETNDMQRDAGRTLQSISDDPAETNQLVQLSRMAMLLEQTESILYSNPVVRTLFNDQRDTIIQSAESLLADPDRVATRPAMKELKTILTKVEKTLETINSEMEQGEMSLQSLPKALRERESRDNLNLALYRISREVKESQLELNHLAAASAEDLGATESQTRAIQNGIRLLTDLADLTDPAQKEVDSSTYEALAEAVTLQSAGKHPIQKIIVGLCESRTPEGEPADIRSAAELLEKEGRKGAYNRIMRDLARIKRWKEKEANLPKGGSISLAATLCTLPTSIKTACRSQILANVEATVEAPVWNNHGSASTKQNLLNQQALNTAYTVMSVVFKNTEKPKSSEKTVLQKAQDLKAAVTEIAQKSDSAWVRSEEFAKALAPGGALAELYKETLDVVLDLPKGSNLLKPTLEFLQSWNAYVGNKGTLLKEAVLLPSELKRTDRVNTASYLATTLEIHHANLRELKGYLSAVTESAEALAETYLQHQSHLLARRHENAATKGSWSEKLTRAAETIKSRADSLEQEIESMRSVFEARREAAEKGEEGMEEFLNPKVSRAFDSLIGQKEYKLQTLVLQQNRLENLQRISKNLDAKGNPLVPAGQKEAKAEEPEIPVDEESTTLARALDAALSTSKQKLELPRRIERDSEIMPTEILDASTAHQRIESAKENLLEVAKTLREVNPKATDIYERIARGNSTENPTIICQELKNALFETLQECEMIKVQSTGGPLQNDPVLRQLKDQMAEQSPELEERRRSWRRGLTSSATKLEKTLLGENLLPTEAPAKAPKAKAKAPEKTAMAAGEPTP